MSQWSEQVMEYFNFKLFKLQNIDVNTKNLKINVFSFIFYRVLYLL